MRCFSVLSHDVSTLQTNGEAEAGTRTSNTAHTGCELREIITTKYLIAKERSCGIQNTHDRLRVLTRPSGIHMKLKQLCCLFQKRK
jgi:hypothetical protein